MVKHTCQGSNFFLINFCSVYNHLFSGTCLSLQRIKKVISWTEIPFIISPLFFNRPPLS
jgi:hypothetical protein